MTSISSSDLKLFAQDLRKSKDANYWTELDKVELFNTLSEDSKKKLPELLKAMYGGSADTNSDGIINTTDFYELAKKANPNETWFGNNLDNVSDNDLDVMANEAEVAAYKLDDEKPADGGHDAHGASGAHSTATPAMGKRDKVADKEEDQNGTKATLAGRANGYGWTDYVKELDKAQGATKDGVITDAADIKAMFGITTAAAEAIFEKAKTFKPNDITDGVGCVLQDIDQNGKITIGKFNDYVENLLKSTAPEDSKKENAGKSEKSSKGGGGGSSTSKVEINNHDEADALKDKIAKLEEEIAELKKHDAKPTVPTKKKGNNTLLYVGAAALAATGIGLFLKDRQRYNNQMAQYQQQCGRKPFQPPAPFCPPQPPRHYAPVFNGPTHNVMANNMFAQG